MRFEKRIIDPALEQQVAKLLRRPRPVTAENIKEVALRIYAWQPHGTGLERIQRFLNLMGTVDAIKAEVGDSDKTTALISNALCITLARMYAVRLPVEEACLRALDDLDKSVEKVAWLKLKVSALCRTYVKRVYAMQLLHDQMPNDEEVSRRLLELGISDVQQTVNELASALREQRAYGVKPCIFQDGLLHANDDAWVFNDGYDILTEMPEGIEWAEPLAMTILGSKREIKKLQPTRYSTDETMSLRFDFRDKLMVAIQPSGELTVDNEIGMIRLRDYFVQADRSKAYELFQIIHLMRLYNLIVPRYVNGYDVPEWPSLPKNKSAIKKYREDLEWRTLVLPRLRVIRDPDALRTALNQELVEAQEETERLARKVARHKVPGFVKALRPGQNATNRARQLAWDERGITLKEGQTYVKTHWRGSKQNTAKGHITHVK